MVHHLIEGGQVRGLFVKMPDGTTKNFADVDAVFAFLADQISGLDLDAFFALFNLG